VAYGQSLEEGLVTLKPETKFYQEVVKPLAPRSKKLCDKKLDEVKLYEGSSILQLAACGLSLAACRSGLDACRLLLEELGA
jgi:hypothetical protein